MKPIAMLALATLASAQAPYRTSFEPAEVVHDIPANRGSAALWQSLKKLRTRASLILITAHPDDEDGGMLALESRGRGSRVALLTLNRGEGGANVMSSDFFDALGLVRTQELLLANRYAGVEQYFTRLVDYGFSKTLDESIRHWTRERALADVVRIVRMTRPLVVTSVFVGGPTDGHGNHQAAGVLAREAYRAAADPNAFPEQIRAGLRPWQPLKHYARTPWFGRGENQFSAHVEIPQGNYDPLLGSSYVQIAREGLGLQKSQTGGGSIPKAGPVTSTYHRFQSQRPAADREQTFFDGIDVSLGGIAELAAGGENGFLKAGLMRVNASVEEAIARFDAAHPERSAPALAAGLKQLLALINDVEKSGLPDQSKFDVRHELQIKHVQFNDALVHSLGLSIAATVAPDQQPSPRMMAFGGDPETFRIAIPGQRFATNVRVVNQSPLTLDLGEVQVLLNNRPIVVRRDVAARLDRTPAEVRFEIELPTDAPLTRPYFTRPDIEQAYYDISDDRQFGRPLPPHPLTAAARLTFDGAPIQMSQVVQTVKRVTGLGTVYEPLMIGPPISVSITPRNGVVPAGSGAFPITVAIRSNVKGPAQGKVRLEAPAGWRTDPPHASFSTAMDGEEQAVRFMVTPAGLTGQRYTITAVAEYAGREYREGYRTVGYAGLPPSFLYMPSTFRASGVDLKVAPALKIGYVMGTGDDVPESLANMGLHATLLSAADLATVDLAQYDTVVFGVRTYAARPELATHHSRILEYVRNGGALIVQYNTPEFDRNYGPYPYSMGNNPEEVTDEASVVNILNPAHPLLNWPNRITAGDFGGWVEERGSKWLRTWDPRYEALLETHDEGQEPQRGGLLYARYGKGVYVYAAWSFYRQLPAGVPGAYRLFANILSIAKNPQR
jgi:LmbE family N-acetylglucosaminyl deacetylase